MYAGACYLLMDGMRWKLIANQLIKQAGLRLGSKDPVERSRRSG
jgi:hypothetical protein